MAQWYIPTMSESDTCANHADGKGFSRFCGFLCKCGAQQVFKWPYFMTMAMTMTVNFYWT